MRKWFGLLLATFVALGIVAGTFVANASPSQTYSGTHFGDGNLPPGCIRSMSTDNPENQCFHMRTGLNALDSPKVDVLILAPASPTVERDMRIMRQAIEMWAGGIDYLAGEMGLPWLKTVDFRITVDAVGNVDTYPVVDPEIVVVASNPVGGVGIGIDPTQFLNELEILDTDGVPCHGIENPFAFETWQSMEGFDQHHGKDEGVYVEDCGGAGGNVCFAVNGAIDPVPGTTDFFSLFDLITHEVGHCLTLGHVGDGAEGAWGPVPTNDIMAYSEDPPGRSKCVSTLDVEAFAVTMSHFLDRNRDGQVDKTDFLTVNDVPGDGRNPFQVQSPSDHLYASQTGSPMDCPQPDVGLLPGAPVDWTPTPVLDSKPQLRLSSVGTAAGRLTVAGNVRYVPRGPKPQKTTASAKDAGGDSTSPFNDLRKLTASVTDTTVDAYLKVGQLWPTTDVTSVGGYSVLINGHRFDSFVPAGESQVMTWDNGREVYLPKSSSWDAKTNTVKFRLPRAYLAEFGITAPYYIGGQSNVQNGKRFLFIDDRAPEGGKTIGVTGPRLKPVGKNSLAFDPPLGTDPYTIDFKAKGGNTFAASSSNGGESLVADNTAFAMDVRSPSKVEVTLDWAGEGSDLDLRVGQQGGESVTGDNNKPEKVVLDNVQGLLDLSVIPFLVGPNGATYTLTAKVTPLGQDSDNDGLTDPGDQCKQKPGPAPSGCPDADVDGVPDKSDQCLQQAGGDAFGCPPPATEWVKVIVDGETVKKVRVDRKFGVGTFRLNLPVARGADTVRVVWLDRKGNLAGAIRKLG